MKRFVKKAKTLIILVCSLCHLLGFSASAKEFPDAIKIVAPDRLSVQIYTQPKLGSEVLAIALHGDVLEASGTRDGFIEVRLPDKKVGYVAKDNAVPWQPPVKKRSMAWLIVLAVVAIVIGAVIVFLVLRTRRNKGCGEACGIYSRGN